MLNKQITRKLCEMLYLEYTNDYTTMSVFAEHMNCRLNIDKPVSFWESIVNRGKLVFHGASYSYFTGSNMPYMNPVNRHFFDKRRIERLLQEHSA